MVGARLEDVGRFALLISAEPLVQQVVRLVVAPVSQLTARVLPVQPAVEVGQAPALGEDGAGQVGTSVIEIPRHSDIRGRLPAVVRDLAVVAGCEPGHHPRLRRSSHRGLHPAASSAASPALEISPLQICAAVHSPRSAHHVYILGKRTAGMLRHKPTRHPEFLTNLCGEHGRLLPLPGVAHQVLRLVLSLVNIHPDSPDGRCGGGGRGGGGRSGSWSCSCSCDDVMEG